VGVALFTLFRASSLHFLDWALRSSRTLLGDLAKTVEPDLLDHPSGPESDSFSAATSSGVQNRFACTVGSIVSLGPGACA
jgi:hypothetical protein